MSDLQEETKKRVSNIRIRTWSLTLALIVGLIIYCLLQWVFTGEIDWLDLFIIGSIQIIVHCLYFPDGENYGTKNITFINNKDAYNIKAEEINKNKKIKELRNYCEIEFINRRNRYIINKLGYIGIDEDDYKELKQLSEKEIKTLKFREINGKMIHFTRKRRNELYKLVFKPIPVEKNEPETIMSAVEYNNSKAIKDNSVTYKTFMYIKRILKSTVIAILFAYISLKLADFTLDALFNMIIYLVFLFTTAVFAFSQGETSITKYKSRFYLELSIFIDGFNEYLEREK